MLRSYYFDRLLEPAVVCGGHYEQLYRKGREHHDGDAQAALKAEIAARPERVRPADGGLDESWIGGGIVAADGYAEDIALEEIPEAVHGARAPKIAALQHIDGEHDAR